MIPTWQLPTPEPVDRRTHDGMAVRELWLRFPPDAPAGGALTVGLLLGNEPAGTHVAVLEASEADAMATATLAWAQALLERRGLLNPTATGSVEPLAKTPSAPEPGTMGQLL